MFGSVWSFDEGESLNTLIACYIARLLDGKYGSSNWGSYSNPQVDSLIEQAQSETNPGTRLTYMPRCYEALDGRCRIYTVKF